MTKTKKDLAEQFPVAVTLRFKTQKDRDRFMGQLSDGWGENHCRLEWPWQDWPESKVRNGTAFSKQDAFGVEVFGDTPDHG